MLEAVSSLMRNGGSFGLDEDSISRLYLSMEEVGVSPDWFSQLVSFFPVLSFSWFDPEALFQLLQLRSQ